MTKIYNVWSKSTKTEVVFTKTKMKNEWNANFLQNSLINIQKTYSSEFSTSQSTPEISLLIWCKAASFYFFKYPPHPQMFTFEMNFQFRKQVTWSWEWGRVSPALTQSSSLPKLFIKKFGELTVTKWSLNLLGKLLNCILLSPSKL